MGILDLGPFRRELEKQQNELVKALVKGHLPQSIAAARVAVEPMQKDLTKGETELKKYTIPDPQAVGSPAFRWRIRKQLEALQELIPSVRDLQRYQNVVKEFDDYADQLRANVQKSYKYLHESSTRKEIWTVHRNAPTKMVIEEIAKALIEWRRFHEPDENFFYVPAKVAVHRLLEEDRPDLGMMLRLATSLPNDIDTTVLQVHERPTWTQAFSFALAMIPIVGNAVAAYEAYTGKDIFGYKLSDAERAIAAAGIVLPWAARAVRTGQALYTADRMARLYGDDAAKWSYSMAMGERVSANIPAMNRLKAADETVAAGKKVARKTAEDLTEIFKALGLDESGKLLKPIAADAKLVDAFKKVSVKFPKLAVLDAYAIERIAAKGANVDHVKGQLLEELFEDYITKLLRDPHGKVALGLEKHKGTFRFVPGHLITDINGFQLTDGAIVRHFHDQIQIIAVFESKSGAASARGLSAKSVSKNAMKASEKAEYYRYAEKALKELEVRAALKGQPPPKVTVDDLLDELINTEKGGQIRKDVERLQEVGMHINSHPVPREVYVGPGTTKWFGVVPKDVKGAPIKKAIEAAGFKKVEVIGFDITQKELISAAEFIIKMFKQAKTK